MPCAWSFSSLDAGKGIFEGSCDFDCVYLLSSYVHVDCIAVFLPI